ncbi:DUF1624 domain-containing protein [Chryseolinea lacunae]|uniref:DUF1624 domain-containing protein n=1 Tax=Chryseolinea lacunae TaxID=2801331 RepID=A0ABS1KNU9_9BACT|nr:heparan-alpha-glucosaminide N-acetyltransferase domain-containing protein [Chryseolinea lacunae]MBL0740942.1 DUF1624 domain-containing protein [Chryseolinea lacunae]
MEPSLKTNAGFFRIQSVDLLRGAVMIIMAIDHVRVYSGIPAGGPTAGVFFTRWITHYCAPAFVFFAGTSAFLYLKKTGSKNEVSTFLLTRGLLLVALELTVIRFFWMFNFDYGVFTFTGVIWMLGWCMVLMAPLIRLSPTALGLAGLVIIFAQQAFHFVPQLFPESMQESVDKVWGFFYPASPDGVAGAGKLSNTAGMAKPFGFSVFYVVIPWIGVMMAGFGFGKLLQKDPAAFRKVCLRVGIGAIVLFLIAGTLDVLMRPATDDATPFLFRLLGQQKYPPSQLYLLMTLGPLIALMPWAERASGALANALKIVGRVPMFFYLLHILLIHLSAFVVNLLLSGTIHQDWYATAPFVNIPETERWGLPLLYLVWAIDVPILYWLCTKYAAYKASRPEVRWLKYV